MHELRRIQEIVKSPYIQAIKRQQVELMRAIAPIMQTRRMLLAKFDFSFIVNIQKSFESITQTFYGLQFSTTIIRDGEDETHAQCNITITQAEYMDIRNERDYYKEKYYYWQAEFNKESKEMLQLQNKFTYIATKSTHKEISSRGGKNSYQKYKPFKNKLLPKNNRQNFFVE